MIIVLSRSLFNDKNGDDVFSKTAQIFDFIIERKCLFEPNNIIDVFLNENGQYIFSETEFAKKYISERNRIEIEEYFKILLHQSSYLTNIQLKYLNTIVIGLGESEIHPGLAVKILNYSSKIILENAANDWKFIEGIVRKYANHKERKSIYRQILRSIENNWLSAEQAGGKGQIKSRIEDLSQNKYKGISNFKIAALFDSDRQNDKSLDHEIKLIISYLKRKPIENFSEAIYDKSDLIVWHMLYKRETENYVPLKIIAENIELGNILNELEIKTPFDLDFIKYEQLLNEIDVKSEFPNLFLKDFTKEILEERCVHHKVQIELPNNSFSSVSEIEQILLKIAKII